MSLNFPKKLDDPVWPITAEDTWKLSDAFEGTQIFGATGSGKTTGSGAMLAKRFLSLQFGGLILTAKPDERERWEDYCVDTGREKDLVIISPKHETHFDFMRYEFERDDEGAGDTTELTALLSSAAKSAGTSISKNSVGESFWAMSLEVLLRNLIELSKLEHRRVSLRHIHELIGAAPVSIEQAESAEWKKRFRTAMANATKEGNMRDLRLTRDYFSDTYARFSDRTRSSIVAMFNNMADVLLRGTIGKLFSSDKVDVRPEHTWGKEQKIFLMDLPVKMYGEAGRIPQIIMKLIWQRAAERRLAEVPIDQHGEHRPVFLWADEAQEFITEQDALFQATARSSRVATVYITQNIRSYHTRLGGDALAEAATDSLLGNLGTKIFHANGDPTTNEWAERLFAQRPDEQSSGSYIGSSLNSHSRQHNFTPVCPAIEFIKLSKVTDLTAEPEKQGVEAVVFQTGRDWKMPERPRSQLSSFATIENPVIQTGSIVRFPQHFKTH